MGYLLEAIDTTMRYVIQQESEGGETVGVGQCSFCFSRSRWMGVKHWRVLPYIFRPVLLESRVAGCGQHRNVLRVCPCWSLVCPAPCPDASTPMAPRSASRCTHPCHAGIAPAYALRPALPGRTALPILCTGGPSTEASLRSRAGAPQEGSSQSLAVAEETAHGRDTHVWTLCRDSL